MKTSLPLCLLSSILYCSTVFAALDPPQELEVESEIKPQVRYSNTTTDPRNPRPEFGLSLLFSPGAFGNQAIQPDQGTAKALAASFIGEFQPAFIQNLGVLGLGAGFTLYPVTGGALTPSLFSVLGASVLARYQFRYLPRQFLVPILAYTVEFVRAEFNGVGVNTLSGNVLTQGPTFGMWVLLDFLEPSAAAHAHINHGVARTYLMLEWRNVTGISTTPIESPLVVASSGSFYIGVRIEL